MLSVQVNGYPLDKIGEFVQRDGVLFSRQGELQDLGIRVPDTLATGPDVLVRLSDLPGVVTRLDIPNQTLYVTAPNDRLVPAIVHVRDTAGLTGPIESGLGATLNYDVSGTSVAGVNAGTGAFDARLFSPWGGLSTDYLAFANGGPAGPGKNSAVRLESTYTYSDVATLRRYSAGDFITNGLAWNRAVRLGGLQITSDFSMRPNLITFPLPSIGGAVAVPSTVDLLVNGNQLLSRQIGAGPFEIPQLPVVTGAGTISMSVTNALGRPVVVTLPFYASATLLAPGLQTYSVQAGAVRQNFGVQSNSYDGLAATAAYRRGLTDWLTVEGSMEAAAGTIMAGGGAAMNLDNFAVPNFNVAGSKASTSTGSTGSGGPGVLLSAGLQRTGRVFSVGASATMASRNFRDIASLYGDQPPRLQLNASASVTLGRFGSIGVAYAELDRYAVPAPLQVYVPPGSVLNQSMSQTGGAFTTVGGLTFFQPAEKAQIASASYSTQIGSVSLYATAFHDFANKGVSGALFGLTIPLGPRSSATVSAGSGASGGYQSVQAVQSPVTIGDWGYQAFGSTGHPEHEFAQLQYKAPFALLQAGADRLDRQTTYQAEAQGAVSVIDGGVFASNSIYGSFALVATNGPKGVHVLQENRPVGTTDSAGRLLVPDLRAFDANQIAIDPTDVPIDSSIDVSTRAVRPQSLSGVVVNFGVTVSHGASLRLVDAAGAPIQVGSTARLLPKGALVSVGYDGEAYVLDLRQHNAVAVERLDGQRCRVAFDYKPVSGEIPRIGPLRCLEQSR